MVKMIVTSMIVVVNFGAAYAGPKTQHISTCATDVKKQRSDWPSSQGGVQKMLGWWR
jgi:hypothetical protein